MDDLIAEILKEMIEELSKTENFNSAALTYKVRNATREIRRERNYPSSYSEEQVAEDLKNYYSNIHDLALYDYNQIGAEGETSHSENGINRTWRNRSECKNGVVAFCKIL